MKHCVVLRRWATEEKPAEYGGREKKFWWNKAGTFTVFPTHAAAEFALEQERAVHNNWGQSRIVDLTELVEA